MHRQENDLNRLWAWVVNIETGQAIAFVLFEDAVQEVFAVDVLHGTRFPDLINHDPQLIGSSYVLADSDLATVPEELRGPERLPAAGGKTG